MIHPSNLICGRQKFISFGLTSYNGSHITVHETVLEKYITIPWPLVIFFYLFHSGNRDKFARGRKSDACVLGKVIYITNDHQNSITKDSIKIFRFWKRGCVLYLRLALIMVDHWWCHFGWWWNRCDGNVQLIAHKTLIKDNANKHRFGWSSSRKFDQLLHRHNSPTPTPVCLVYAVKNILYEPHVS